MKSRARATIEEARGDRHTGVDSGDSCRPAVRAGNLRLPKTKLPYSSDKALEFPIFWGQFEASIHNRSDLDAATKFTYLIFSTVGRARNSIEGVPFTATNYPQVPALASQGWSCASTWRHCGSCRSVARCRCSLVDEVTKLRRCFSVLDKDSFAGPLPLSESLMPMLRDKFPPALLRACDTKIGPDAGEDEDNL
ncbi:hypothetical protein T4D_5918 [Trichinella pseudospiralis]|uniref:Uncharacterized protein n=1 Tax=Trichinella pseudospiralis TaxID=6337 RepID=A0A0V1FBX0_TRIPS|nr:hypothetical protein T4D_5918 [Trichinella pseudospiralis]